VVLSDVDTRRTASVGKGCPRAHTPYGQTINDAA